MKAINFIEIGFYLKKRRLRSKRATIYLVALVLFVISCSDSKTQNKVYKHYSLEHNNWKSKRNTQFVNNINYSATEVPLRYYLLKNLGNDFKAIDSVYAANNEERIIEIEFQHIDNTDLLEQKYTRRNYEDAVKYMAFNIKKDFTVVTSSNDTIKCSGANFERNFKVAPYKKVLLYFNGIAPEDNISLIYQDQLFGNDIIKFNLSETPIKL